MINSVSISNVQCDDYKIENLPGDPLMEILSNLKLSDLGKMCTLSKKWATLADNPLPWLKLANLILQSKVEPATTAILKANIQNYFKGIVDLVLSKRYCSVGTYTVFDNDFIEELKINPSLNGQVAAIKDYMDAYVTSYGSLLSLLAQVQYDGYDSDAEEIQTPRQVFDLALQIGVNPDRYHDIENFGYGFATPLCAAMSRFNFQTAKKLIDAGADLCPGGKSVFQTIEPRVRDRYEKQINDLEAYVAEKREQSSRLGPIFSALVQ